MHAPSGILFPYGEVFGDEVIREVYDGSRGIYLDQFNISYPFFGVVEDVIYVSTMHTCLYVGTMGS